MSLLPYLFADGLEAGVDEVGRGALAGPVVAAAVIFLNNFQDAQINDSKKLSAQQRDSLATLIKANAIFCVAEVSAALIDRMNILRATYLAMHQALDGLAQMPARILVDGSRFAIYKNIPYFCEVKGDARYQSIAAASILAKQYRDTIMQDYALVYPEYGFEQHKGYATPQHLNSLQKNGLTPLHRKTFCRTALKKPLNSLFTFDASF